MNVGHDFDHGDLVSPPVVVVETAVTPRLHLGSGVLRVGQTADPDI